MAGSLVFTLAGMGLLAYLDRHATGSPEGRLAAAYALASALTILFIVFNPAGELEILNLLKGEVISLSKEELKLLAIVYGVVYVGLVLVPPGVFAELFRPRSFLSCLPAAARSGAFGCTCCAVLASPSALSWPGRCWFSASWFCRRWRRALWRAA